MEWGCKGTRIYYSLKEIGEVFLKKMPGLRKFIPDDRFGKGTNFSYIWENCLFMQDSGSSHMGETGAKAISLALGNSLRNKDSVNRIVWLILGGKDFLPQEPASAMEYVRASAQGIPKQSVINLAEILNVPMKDIAHLLNISYKTLGRLQKKDRLDPLESSLSIELANLTAKGVSVFEDSGRFNTWLKKENRALGGKKPFELLNTPTGINMVAQVLDRIEEGVYT